MRPGGLLLLGCGTDSDLGEYILRQPAGFGGWRRPVRPFQTRREPLPGGSALPFMAMHGLARPYRPTPLYLGAALRKANSSFSLVFDPAPG